MKVLSAGQSVGTIGHCYLKLFVGEALAEAKKLDAFTTGAALRRIANSYAIPFAEGTFGLAPVKIDGKAVWHVVDGPWTPAVCIAMVDKGSLVGATGVDDATAKDVSRQVHEVAEKNVHTATEIKAQGLAMVRRFHFSFALGGVAGQAVSCNVWPFALPRIVAVSRLFESVRLTAMSLEVVVDASTTARVGIGLNSANAHARDVGQVRRLAHNMIAYGHSDGPKVSVWDLPDRLNFSREYKMSPVGNGPPYVACHYAGPTGQKAEINGFMEIAFAGEGVTMPMRLDPAAQHKNGTAGSTGRANVSRARVPREEADDDEVEESEDE